MARHSPHRGAADTARTPASRPIGVCVVQERRIRRRSVFAPRPRSTNAPLVRSDTSGFAAASSAVCSVARSGPAVRARIATVRWRIRISSEPSSRRWLSVAVVDAAGARRRARSRLVGNGSYHPGKAPVRRLGYDAEPFTDLLPRHAVLTSPADLAQAFLIDERL